MSIFLFLGGNFSCLAKRGSRLAARGSRLAMSTLFAPVLFVKNQVYQFADLEVGQRVLLGAHTVPILPLRCPLDCWESMINNIGELSSSIIVVTSTAPRMSHES